MAKRFTDTDKWRRPWFTDLDLKAKMAWIYLLDNCDHRGVWHADFKLMSFQLGYKVSREILENWFLDKIKALDDKYFIPSFVAFQYKELNPNNNAHKEVIKLIENLGPSEDLVRGSAGAQDKDKDKDKDKVNKGGVGEKLDFASAYKMYPLKKGKEKGLKICRTQIKTQADLEDLKKAINNYAAEIAQTGTDPKYIKHFSTFMGAWRDYLDPETGTCTVTQINKGPTPIEELLKRGVGE